MGNQAEICFININCQWAICNFLCQIPWTIGKYSDLNCGLLFWFFTNRNAKGLHKL